MSDSPIIIDASGQNFCYPYEIRHIDTLSSIFQAVEDACFLNKKIIMFGIKHSQAGQICYNDAIALDMNSYNRIIELDLDQSQITVESGIQWKEIQEAIDPYGLAIQVMQFVNTFSVGGSMSANIFSRDPRKSRLIETIISFTLVNAKGEILCCSRQENNELFSLVLEGHGLFGIIAEVTLQLTSNLFLVPSMQSVSPEEYVERLPFEVKVDPTLAYHDAQYNFDNHSFMEKIHFTNFYEKSYSAIENCENMRSRNDWMSEGRNAELTFWNPLGSDALLGFFIPLNAFIKFHYLIKSIIQQTPIKVFKCSTNYLPGNQESFLSSGMGPTMKLAIFYRQEGDNKGKQHADAFKELCALATLEARGAPYLTFDFKASVIQMDAFYPQWREFLRKKRLYDPKELFYNNFYKKLCDLEKSK